MTCGDPVQYYKLVIIYVITHGRPSQLGTVPGDFELKEIPVLELTREPHRVVVNLHLYLGGCIHTVNVITLYETAKGFYNYFTFIYDISGVTPQRGVGNSICTHM